MKNILLGSSVLVGAAALFAGAAFAGETPKITLGGFTDFQVGVVSEDNSTGADAGTDADTRSGAFRTETEISFKIDAKTDSGLGYGGAIYLPVDAVATNANLDQTTRSFVYLDGAWGKLEGGTNTGAAAALEIDAGSIARATGGIDGDWNYFMTATAAGAPNAANRGIFTPDGLLDHGTTAQFGDESTESINKVTYYTPRFAVFQAGVSYLFDTNATARGRTPGSRTDASVNQAENVFTGGINYAGEFSGVTVGLSATGELGSAEQEQREDLRTYNLGAKVGYMGFTVAGSYSDWSDSLSRNGVAAGTSGDIAAVNATSDASFWTLGAAYEFGPFGASVTYMNSQFDPETIAAGENEFTNLSVGVDYKLAPGFTPYAEVSFVEADSATNTSDNDATVFIAGTQLAF